MDYLGFPKAFQLVGISLSVVSSSIAPLASHNTTLQPRPEELAAWQKGQFLEDDDSLDEMYLPSRSLT